MKLWRYEKEEFLAALYNLLLDIEVKGKERELYKRAVELVEVKKEYYEAVAGQLAVSLGTVARAEKLSKAGSDFLNELVKFTKSGRVSFMLFEDIIRK